MVVCGRVLPIARGSLGCGSRLPPDPPVGAPIPTGGGGASAGFDPERDLQRIGLANQTTMLMAESLEIGGMLRAAFRERYGHALEAHFQAFDTICSATQDRQDAVVALLRDRPIDLMIVIGGYNSSIVLAVA